MNRDRRLGSAAYLFLLVLGACALLERPLAGIAPARAGANRTAERWVGTWATALVARPQQFPPVGAGSAAPANAPRAPAPAQAAPQTAVPATGSVPPGDAGPRRGFAGPPPVFRDQTLRQIVHVSLGGQRVRVVFSNAFGTAPLEIGAAHVALRETGPAIAAGSARALTFAGRPSAAIPPGAVLVSDPVDLAVPALADLAVDLYLPGDIEASASPFTTHLGAQQTSYVSTSGNQSGVPELPVQSTTASWYFLARVEVAAGPRAGAVVAFGDSITDGTRSTPDTNRRWPDFLAQRLAAAKLEISVLNQGIAGNRVLGDGAGVSALARFDRDVLVQTGATHVIVLESINDIGLARENPTPSAADLIAGQRQLIERAHARGLKIYGATLTPFIGARYATPEGEAKRQAVNEWIRTSQAYDGVIDFDRAVRDPGDPTRLLPQYNPGDNLHMTDAGYQAMADAIDLSLFQGSPRR
jgi:lysophospholipase L1-like esterase